MAEDDAWLGTEQAARRLGITAVTLRRMLERGEIPSTAFERRRGRRVVHRAVLDALIEQRRVNPGDLAHLDSNRWPKYRPAE